MVAQVSTFEWKPCDDRVPVPGIVASVACAVADVTTIINVASTTFRDVQIPVNFILVDNYENATTQDLEMGPVSYVVPAYKRSIFRVPPTAKSIKLTLSTDCNVVLSNVADYLVAEADEIAIQQAANQFVSYPWITLTAGRALNQSTDQNKNILLSAASAQTYTLGDVTALPNGYYNPMVRNAGTGRWTLQPDSGQNLNTDWTNTNPLLLSQNDQISLSSDGNQWHASGEITFESAEQTLVSAGLVTVAHGLVRRPSVQAFLRCVIAQNGYAIGDEMPMIINDDINSATGDFGGSIVVDATNIRFRYTAQATIAAPNNFTTGARAALTAANWRLFFRASVKL